MRRAKPSSTSRVAAGPSTGRWQPKSTGLFTVDGVLGDRIVLDHLHHPRALDLTAGRLGNGARAHEDHARRPVTARAMNAARDLADEVVEIVGRGVLAAHLGDDVQALGARPLAVDPDGGRVAHPRYAIDDLLDVGRDDVLAAEDD